MNAVQIDGLPPGARVTGTLYDDPSLIYPSGDVFEVSLPNCLMIDVGWHQDDPEGPFRIVVYQDYYGNQKHSTHVRTIAEVVETARQLAWEYSGSAFEEPKR